MNRRDFLVVSSVFATCDLAKPYNSLLKPESFRPIADCTTVIDGEFTRVDDFGSDRGLIANVSMGCVFEGQFNNSEEKIRGVSVVGTDANGWDVLLQYGKAFFAGDKVIGFRENSKEIVMWNKEQNFGHSSSNYKTNFNDRYVYNKEKQELTVLLRVRHVDHGVRGDWKTSMAFKLGCKKI